MPLTVMACWACGAGWYRAFPAWFASMTHLPALLKVTVEPEIEHTEPLPGSMLRITGLPDSPPETVTAYLPPAAGLAGGTEVKETDWAILVPPLTVMACWACGRGRPPRDTCWTCGLVPGVPGLVRVDDAPARVVEGHGGTGDRAHRAAAGSSMLRTLPGYLTRPRTPSRRTYRQRPDWRAVLR